MTRSGGWFRCSFYVGLHTVRIFEGERHRGPSDAVRTNISVRTAKNYLSTPNLRYICLYYVGSMCPQSLNQLKFEIERKRGYACI